MQLILAPMQGLTEVMYRRVYSHCFPEAIDSAVSPFLSLTHGNLEAACKKIDDVLPEVNTGLMPVVPQILGRETDEFVALANRLSDLGYTEVNWNIGCPVRRVAHKHRGSGILPYPQEVAEILESVLPRLKCRLSVKMRLGYADSEEIFRLIPILNQFPLASVIVHPRTGLQQYGGSVDMDTFRRVVPLLLAPVVYNGDINSVAQYMSIRQEFHKLQGIMIGRGIVRDPTLPLQIRAAEGTLPSHLSTDNLPQQRRDMQMELLTAIAESPISMEAKTRKAKEYWCLTADGFGLDASQRRSVLLKRTFGEVCQTIDQLLQIAV